MLCFISPGSGYTLLELGLPVVWCLTGRLPEPLLFNPGLEGRRECEFSSVFYTRSSTAYAFCDPHFMSLRSLGPGPMASQLLFEEWTLSVNSEWARLLVCITETFSHFLIGMHVTHRRKKLSENSKHPKLGISSLSGLTWWPHVSILCSL